MEIEKRREQEELLDLYKSAIGMDIVSFALAKILWLFAAPGNLFVLLLLPSAFMASSANRKRLRRWPALTAFLAPSCCLSRYFRWETGCFCRWKTVSGSNALEGVDGIIMLAGDEDGALTEKGKRLSSALSAPRYIAFAALARQYPGAQLAFIGGTNAMNPASPVTNGVIAKEGIVRLGLPRARIIYEDKSRNTYENAVVWRVLVVKPGPERKWLLVTSAYHMPRALATFRNVLDGTFSVPADYWTTGEFRFMPSFEFSRHLRALNMAVHEYAGLAAYYLMGRL